MRLEQQAAGAVAAEAGRSAQVQYLSLVFLGFVAIFAVTAALLPEWLAAPIVFGFWPAIAYLHRGRPEKRIVFGVSILIAILVSVVFASCIALDQSHKKSVASLSAEEQADRAEWVDGQKGPTSFLEGTPQVTTGVSAAALEASLRPLARLKAFGAQATGQMIRTGQTISKGWVYRWDASVAGANPLKIHVYGYDPKNVTVAEVLFKEGQLAPSRELLNEILKGLLVEEAETGADFLLRQIELAANGTSSVDFEEKQRYLDGRRKVLVWEPGTALDADANFSLTQLRFSVTYVQ